MLAMMPRLFAHRPTVVMSFWSVASSSARVKKYVASSIPPARGRWRLQTFSARTARVDPVACARVIARPSPSAAPSAADRAVRGAIPLTGSASAIARSPQASGYQVREQVRAAPRIRRAPAPCATARASLAARPRNRAPTPGWQGADLAFRPQPREQGARLARRRLSISGPPALRSSALRSRVASANRCGRPWVPPAPLPPGSRSLAASAWAVRREQQAEYAEIPRLRRPVSSSPRARLAHRSGPHAQAAARPRLRASRRAHNAIASSVRSPAASAIA